jgi:hypothetical protein
MQRFLISAVCRDDVLGRLLVDLEFATPSEGK